MKWFKHFSDSLEDPFIQELMDKFGAKGYLAWFGLLEVIAKENGSDLTGKLSINPTYLSRKLRLRVATMSLVYRYSVTLTKLSCTFEKEQWHFDVPKMLELKDNYIKDLQGSGKKLSLEVEEEVEVEEEKDTKKIKTKKSVSFIKPTVQEVTEYCSARGNSINPQQFVDFYEAGGWKRGRTPIKDWKACVRTWESNHMGTDTLSGMKEWLSKTDEKNNG